MEAIFHEQVTSYSSSVLTILIIYKYQQDGSLCAQHCLNSLLQGQFYSAVDLADLAKELDTMERLRMAEVGEDTPEYRQFMQVSVLDPGTDQNDDFISSNPPSIWTTLGFSQSKSYPELSQSGPWTSSHCRAPTPPLSEPRTLPWRPPPTSATSGSTGSQSAGWAASGSTSTVYWRAPSCSPTPTSGSSSPSSRLRVTTSSSSLATSLPVTPTSSSRPSPPSS